MLPHTLGKGLIIVGLILIIVGGLLVYGGPLSCLGRLPGDIRIERLGLKFYFPLTTCILISIVLSLILFVISRFR